MSTVDMQGTGSPVHPQHRYRGRVRSGCLTCRSRKVRCDELKPSCHNCTRRNRRCVYQPRKGLHFPAAASNAHSESLADPTQGPEIARSPHPSPHSPPHQNALLQNECLALGPPLERHGGVFPSRRIVQDMDLSRDNSIIDLNTCLEDALKGRKGDWATAIADDALNTTQSALISRDIELTTTMDLLMAREPSLQHWFMFFVEAVECPAITPYDGQSWRRMKQEIIKLGSSHSAIASAILAVSVLQKAQLYALSLSRATALYQASRAAYEKLLDGEPGLFDKIMVVAFLLCLFEFTSYETIGVLEEPTEKFLQQLEIWTLQSSSHCELSLRVAMWLRLLHVATMRGGCLGLISDRVCSLLSPCHPSTLANIRSLSDQHLDTSAHLYGVLSAPIFEFYYNLQMISARITKLTHYHRARNTVADQEEVILQSTHIKHQLHALWEGRSVTQRQKPQDIRSRVAPEIADPVITLTGLCTAAYNAELIELDRVMGDPLSEWRNSKQAMQRVHEVLDGDWNVYDDAGKLNAGYLRPLFLYAIECMDRDENQWAVEKIQQIKSPICRSDFFAAFGKALLDTQLRKDRRVASKYFSIWYFGGPPPFM